MGEKETEKEPLQNATSECAFFLVRAMIFLLKFESGKIMAAETANSSESITDAFVFFNKRKSLIASSF